MNYSKDAWNINNEDFNKIISSTTTIKNTSINERRRKMTISLRIDYPDDSQDVAEKEKAYDELVYTPAKYHIRRHIVYTYKCPNCGETPENDDNYADDIEHCNIRRAA